MSQVTQDKPETAQDDDRPGAPGDETSLPLSQLLVDILEGSDERVTVDQLMHMFGGRALGGMLLIFGLFCALPLPPGATTILGAPLLLLAPQMMIGKAAPWLPRRVRTHSIATADLRRALPRALPWLRRLEAISRPRLRFLFAPFGQRLIGMICTLLAIVIILPIPLGNLVPALAVTILSLAVVQRDGLLAIAGYGAVGASMGLLIFAFRLISQAVSHVLTNFAGA
ncbi:exopolysaccharide biosynthesis protein [Phenylobacterium immobile]|uniref:exopolysaccharide biosynthesis protein n=1 Tax=Phenylobacterium immobile TaxID=21 RepID=UPI000AE4AAD6|nr:exopolysaccharide biosynthesis protein [Phenylobacterium immobile]